MIWPVRKAIASVALALAVSTALPQELPSRPSVFHLDSQPLAAALNAWAQQAGVQLVWEVSSTASKQMAPRVVGSYTPQQALQLLLQGSGFEYFLVDQRTVAIMPSKQPQAATAAADRHRAAHAAETVMPLSESGGTNKDGERAFAEVVVTGTHIRGTSSPVPAMLRFDRVEIQQSGAGTTEQFIQTLPQNFNGGMSAANLGGPANSGGEGANLNLGLGTGANLRGLGNDSTLVLLNGRRVASAGTGYFVDLSLVPLDAIESIEVLTDGASAVYGSDAVGGVVNLILRDDFNGAESRVRYGQSARGGNDDIQAGQLFGRSWESGSILASGSYENQSSLKAGERSATSTVPAPTDLVMPERRHSVFVSLSQFLSDRVRLFGDGLYSKRAGVLLGNFGSRSVFDIQTELYGVTVGGECRLSGDWHLQSVASFSESGTDLDLKFPDFAFASAFDGRAEVTSLDLQAEGALAEIPGGLVRLAAGVHGRRETYSSRGEIYAALTALDRQIYAMFGEILLPLVGPANEVALAKRIELSLAARFERYDDFGSTVNPKLSVLWTPHPAIGLKGTIGTSFRAPLLYELDENSFSTAEARNLSDPASPSGVTPTLIRRGNNAALEAEKATTWMLGAELSPPRWPNWTTSLAYFEVRYTDRIATPVPAAGTLSALESPQLHASAILRDPDVSLVNELYAGAVLFNPENIPATQIRAILDNRLTNIASRQQNGIDLSTTVSIAGGRSRWSLALMGTYLANVADKVTPAAPQRQLVDTVYFPSRLRARGKLGWERNGLNVSGFVNYTGAYSDHRSSPPLAGPPIKRRVDCWTTLDLSISYEYANDLPEDWQSGLQVSLTAQNLLDADPPFVAGPYGLNFDTANANAIGRFVALQLRKRW